MESYFVIYGKVFVARETNVLLCFFFDVVFDGGIVLGGTGGWKAKRVFLWPNIRWKGVSRLCGYKHYGQPNKYIMDITNIKGEILLRCGSKKLSVQNDKP